MILHYTYIERVLYKYIQYIYIYIYLYKKGILFLNFKIKRKRRLFFGCRAAAAALRKYIA